MRFLTAQWRNLVMVNYEVDPKILEPFVPAGTELDAYEGNHYLSLVAFMFEDTKLLGVKVPYHTKFEEINLRFYVRRFDGSDWRRGVVFIKEIVPKRAVAKIANLFYRERYVAQPMGHLIVYEGERPKTLEYKWRHEGSWNRIHFEAEGDFQPMKEGSHPEFIAEHYFGYTAWSDKTSLEYRVEHPKWNYAQSLKTTVECDVRAVYGSQFEETLMAKPVSSFLCDGSPVTVYKGSKIA